MTNEEYKLLEKQMDSNEISDFVKSSFKYTFINEDDARKISRENKTKLVRYGDKLENGRMKYVSMRDGKLNPFVGEVHSAFKADTWLKYSDEYKIAIVDLAEIVKSAEVEIFAELCDLSEYLLPKKKESEHEDKE